MFTPLTPIRCLHRAMDLFPNRVGVVDDGKEFTYREFGERSQKLGTALKKLGVARADRVAYLSFNTHQLLEGYYGVILAHAIVMPLNVRLSPLELVNILNHSGAKVLMFETDFAPMVAEFRKQCPGVEKYVSLSSPVDGADVTLEELLEIGTPERVNIFDFDENSIAELFYTSGSTGTPKGVALSHRTLYLHALSVATLFEQPRTMVDLHTIPLFHANGWGRPQASTMMGTRQVMVRRFDPPAVLRTIAEQRATDMQLVPTMANALINCTELGKHDTSSMRKIMIGGAASSPELLQRLEKAFPSAEVFAGYGLTETCPVVSTGVHKPGLEYKDDAEKYRRCAMAGWAVPGVEIRVVDFNNNDVPRDGVAIGEIVVRGDHVMEGYYREPAATEAVMTDQWFHTGDMAVWDEENYIHIVDRKKEIIISGGENISSLEVEKAIFAHPAVLECAVVAAPDTKWGEVPAAIVVVKPGAQLTETELIEFVAARLGRFKLPRIVQFSEDPLPKTGTGKIRKMVLKEQFWAGKEKRVQG